MEIEEMLAQADYLMHIAVSKCDSWEDAQDLVQETILDGLHAIRKGVDINNARNWLCTVLNRKYYDLLREKYRKPLEFYGMDFDVAMEEVNNQATDVDEDGLTEEEILARIASQAREFDLLPKTKTETIDNSGEIPLLDQIDKLLESSNQI